MVLKAKNTEEIILDAAREVFLQKGFAAARMCDIAKTANINQAMLHYYFRKKDKLFEIIFEQESQKFYSSFITILNSDLSFFEKLRRIVETDIQKNIAAPFLPLFILNEMHTNPVRMEQFLGSMQRHETLYMAFHQLVEQEQAAGRIWPVCPRQLFLSILGLTMFPFLAKPLIKHILDLQNQSFDQLIQDRVDYAGDMLIRSLQPS